MKLGIVGSEQAKFTKDTEAKAREVIRKAIQHFKPTHVVSGHCHLGGVDIYAEEEGLKLGVQLEIYPPKTFTWSGGYKPRNLQIANNSDVVLCISVKELPSTYDGMTFKDCYHCHGRNPPHVKSGGCWTAWRAKKGIWRIV